METSFALGDSVSSSIPVPYSVGKLIEWKRQVGVSGSCSGGNSPYSVGKLIEWKH